MVPALFDAAEEAFDAPVRILVNNATGWVGDCFSGGTTDHIDRQLRPVSAATHDQQHGCHSDGTVTPSRW